MLALTVGVHVGETTHVWCGQVRPQPPQRRTPGVLAQIVYFFARSLSQQTRDLKSLVIDFALVFIGGLFMGLVFNKLTFDGLVAPFFVLDEHGMLSCVLHQPPW